MSRTDKDLPLAIRLPLIPEIPYWKRFAATPSDIRTEWTGPDRARSRAELRAALAEYAATGDIDLAPATAYHHHTTSGRC
jgi:hypothetical protein